MLTPGTILQNRYRIVSPLGQGGMGAVYRAWDMRLNIPAAVKEMVPQPGIAPHTLAQLRQQFYQEAQVLARLNHPHLVRVTDYFEEGGNAYLVMDFVEGQSLADLIAARGPLPEAQVLEWAHQLLDALAYCHAQGVVHRDIKPQNIIIRADGRPILVDFGLVKLWDPRRPETQHIVRGMGTYEFASPEHFHLGGQHTSPRSDLYSLGATLYYALTGQEPPSAMDRWAQQVPLIPPRGPQIPPQLTAVILRAMELDPNHRFADARQMQAALLRNGRFTGGGIPAGQGEFQQNLQQTAGFVHVYVQQPAAHPPVQASGPVAHPRAVPLPRDTRWPLEMATGTVMALIGVLAIQVILFARWMTFALYFGRSLSALVLGALGWFIGDLIFQALARPEATTAQVPSRRPTQRLVAFTRSLTRRLTTGQQIALLATLLVVVVLLVWLLAPTVARMPFVVNYVSFYASIAPLVYAAVGRRPGRAGLAHVLAVTMGSAVAATRVFTNVGLGELFLAALAGGLLMEGAAFLAERTLIK